jgi:hypothetical protein
MVLQDSGEVERMAALEQFNERVLPEIAISTSETAESMNATGEYDA